MGAATLSLDEAQLSRFSPLDTLHPEALKELRPHIRVERFPPGKRLFDRGESPRKDTVFLLSGQLALVTEDKGARTLKAGSADARRPITQETSRIGTALARTSVTLLFVDAEALGRLVERNGDADIQGTAANHAIQSAAPTSNHSLTPETAAVLLDVRSPRAFARRHIPGSINLPLRVLRHAAAVLDKSRSYVICGNGRRAAAAVSALDRHGVTAKMWNGNAAGYLRPPQR